MNYFAFYTKDFPLAGRVRSGGEAGLMANTIWKKNHEILQRFHHKSEPTKYNMCPRLFSSDRKWRKKWRRRDTRGGGHCVKKKTVKLFIYLGRKLERKTRLLFYTRIIL